MQSVLSKSLLLYQNAHGGRTPKKIYVHKSSHFTGDEIQGAFDAFDANTELELVQVVRANNWYGLKVDRRRERSGPAGVSSRSLIFPAAYGQRVPPVDAGQCRWNNQRAR